VLAGNHLFVIFAVLDVACAVNSCINHSFFYILCYIQWQTNKKSYIWSIERRHFQWPWTTPTRSFKKW